jgi:oligoribonuclease (3'-5' exoribonuclease)
MNNERCKQLFAITEAMININTQVTDLQQGITAQAMEEAINQMDEGIAFLESIRDTMDEATGPVEAAAQ